MGSFRPPKESSIDENNDAPVNEIKIRQIAQVLGVSADVFTNEAQAQHDLKDLHDLIEIWAKLSSYEDRDRLLTFACGLLIAE